MADFNKVMLMGNLTRDPEVRYTPSGTAVADLRMAINRNFRGSDGETREETCFVGVTVWARQAETCGQYLKKGSPVFVEGRLKYDEWEKEGQKFNRLTVVGERVQFLGAPSQRGGYADGPSSNEREPAPPPPGGAGNELQGDDDDLPF